MAFLVGKSIESKCLEQNGTKMPRHKSRETLQLRADTENQGEQKVVAGYKTKERLLREVAEIYSWIEQQLSIGAEPAGQCSACGECCDFDAFEHRLFVTVPELMYLAANLNVEKLEPMLASRCPYNIDGKCSVYEWRFAGCRIFCCRTDADFQSSLSEAALDKLKAICLKFEIPYLYTDLASALNDPVAV